MKSARTNGAGWLMAILFLGVLAFPASADWNPEDPYKWVQYPDLSPMGMDVNCQEPFLLADDFECNQQGPLTDIHIWGSWYHDHIPFQDWPEGVTFTLSIHSDIPADQSPTGYSMPGELLWLRTFPAGEFVARIWAEDLMEGWMDPPDIYEFPGDTVCWQYNFLIPEDEAFRQEGTPDNPIVYWLDVQATPEDPEARFGWKTSEQHWNDSAVWGQGPEPYNGPWFQLLYPPLHEMAGQPIDLAFVITGGTEPDELDFGDAPDPSYPTLLTNDGARHLIQPGFFLGNLVDSDPNGQPSAGADGDDLLDGSDDEDGVVLTSPLYPGSIATVDVTAFTAGGLLDAYIDFDGNGSFDMATERIIGSQPLAAGVNNLSFNVPASAQPGLSTYARFRYSSVGGLAPFGLAQDGEVEDYKVQIVDQPRSTLGDRVWDDLDGSGLQDPGEPGHPNVQVDLYDGGGNLIATTFSAADGSYFFGNLIAGSYFLHFTAPAGYNWTAQDIGPDDTIDSDVDSIGRTPWITIFPGVDDFTWDAGLLIPGVAYKWEQFPDLSPMGIDVNCQDPYILADDFLCTVSGPITEVWVWGSWLGDHYPFDQQPDQVFFTLSFHPDIPAEANPDGYSMPGPPLWTRDFHPGEFMVEHFAEGPEGWMDPPDLYIFPGDHNCWLYRFQIDPDEGFWQYGTQEQPQVLWLDVQAHPLDPEARFGWKTSELHWNDDAVWGMGNEPYPGPWGELRYPPDHELHGESIDLAFALMGEEMPLSLDFGDAPDPSYPTLLASDGARHTLVSGVFLGSGVDSEPDGQPDPSALGDDNDGNNDEDGVILTSALIPGGVATVDVIASAAGFLDAWIDFDGDGNWAQPYDRIFAAQPLSPGVNNLSFALPANGMSGHTSFARFRYSLGGAPAPTGVAYGGQVVDHEVWIVNDTTAAPEALPERFGLRQNMPNPFNPVTMIVYEVPAGGGRVLLEVFDIAGRKVATLVDGSAPAGRHQVTWRGTDATGQALPSGVYFCCFVAPDYERGMKMLMIR